MLATFTNLRERGTEILGRCRGDGGEESHDLRYQWLFVISLTSLARVTICSTLVERRRRLSNSEWPMLLRQGPMDDKDVEGPVQILSRKLKYYRRLRLWRRPYRVCTRQVIVIRMLGYWHLCRSTSSIFSESREVGRTHREIHRNLSERIHGVGILRCMKKVQRS